MEFAKNYLERLTNGLFRVPPLQFEKIADILLEAYDRKNQVFIFGNGGSAATASHMASDLGKGTVSNAYDTKERRFRAIALTDNMSLFSALANDLGYDYVFSQQLQNMVQPHDVVIGISASGNSENVINALILAKQMGATTIGFLGFDGGKMKKFCDHYLHFEENSLQLSEDAHVIFQHIITSYLADKKRERDGQSQSGLCSS